MKITKRQLRRIINEEATKLLVEITPGAAGQAAMGGLTPADQGFAAAAADDHARSHKSSVETKTPEQWADFVYDVISTELWGMGSDEIIEGSNIGDGLEIIRRAFKDAARGPTR